MAGIAINLAHLAVVGLGAWGLARFARSRAPDWAVWAATLVASALVAGLLLDASGPPRAFEDYLTAYLPAGRAVLEGPEALRPLLELGVNGFVNLPILAYLFAPLALLPDAASAVVFFGLGGLAVLAAWMLLRRRYGLDRAESVLSLFALAAFGPLVYSVREGNTSHFLLLPLVGGACLLGRRDLLAGAAFASAALIKPPLLLVGVYYALRGRLRVVAGGLALCVAAAALSVAVFGWDVHRLWIEDLRAYGGLPMPAHNAQSIASAVVRLLHGPESHLDWTPYALPALGQAVVWALVAALAGAGLWAAALSRARRPLDPVARDTELWLVVAFVCVASTVSWSHYYVWLVPGLTLVLAQSREAPRVRPYLAAAYALAAPLVLYAGEPLGGALGTLAGLLASHLLLAGLLAYGLLVLLRAGVLGSSLSASRGLEGLGGGPRSGEHDEQRQAAE